MSALRPVCCTAFRRQRSMALGRLKPAQRTCSAFPPSQVVPQIVQRRVAQIRIAPVAELSRESGDLAATIQTNLEELGV